MNTRELWNAALVEIELTLSRANFSTWFKNTAIVKFEDGTIYLGVPNEFVKDWLATKYHSQILKTLRNINEQIRNLEYLISKLDSQPKEVIIPQSQDKQQFINKQLPFNEPPKEDGLNPSFTFQNFIVGPFNELAYVAAQSIVANPGVLYNPFFIYGGTGLGKTHLLQAIGNEIRAKFPEKKILYTSLERFSIDYVNSMQVNKINQFKEKYRKYDLFIMDDIQFISGKEKTQDELFHLFNILHDSNKQIVFCSDKHPNFIIGLEDRLKSRFNAGMIVDISQPDYESRLAILKSKISPEVKDLISDDVLSFIAETVQGNVRELKGVLNVVLMQSQMKGGMISVNEIKKSIKNNVKTKKNISVKEIVKIIADYYSIEEDLIYNKTRRKDVVKPRQVVMYILREDFSTSYPSIGEKMGGRDHTTVIHSCEKIKSELKTNALLMKELEEIRSMII